MTTLKYITTPRCPKQQEMAKRCSNAGGAYEIRSRVQLFALETYSMAAELDKSTIWDYENGTCRLTLDGDLEHGCCITTHLAMFLYHHHSYLMENVPNKRILWAYCDDGLFSSQLGIYLSALMMGIPIPAFTECLIAHGAPKFPYEDYWLVHPIKVWESMIINRGITSKLMEKYTLDKAPEYDYLW